MPKKSPATKKSPRKKIKVEEFDGDISGALITASCSADFLRGPAFMEALERSGLVESLTEVFKAQQMAETAWLHIRDNWSKERWDAEIEESAKRFKESIPAGLFAGALIIATQVCASGHVWNSVHKNTIRHLAEYHFLTKRRRSMVDGRGRKPKVKAGDVYSAIVSRGADASRKGVAFDLGISEKALDNWRKLRRHPTWKAAVKYALEQEERINRRLRRNKLSA